MNSIKTINTEYLRSSRTIDTVLVTHLNTEKVFFVYNYEGISFRLFTSHVNLINFFADDFTEGDFHFEDEEELDLFLSNVDLQSIN